MRNLDDLGFRHDADHSFVRDASIFTCFEQEYTCQLPHHYRIFLSQKNGGVVDVGSFNDLSGSAVSRVSHFFGIGNDCDDPCGLRSHTDLLRKIFQREEICLVRKAENKTVFIVQDCLTRNERIERPDLYPVAIGEDGSGNLIFIDSRDKGVYYYHFESDSIRKLANFFDEFIDGLYQT